MTVEDGLKLGGVESFALDEQGGEVFESQPPAGEDLAGDRFGLVEHSANLEVDLPGGPLAPGV